jgi:hypothetical protein
MNHLSHTIRNAVKETRDVGFILFTMAIGMAVGTRFYLLAVIGALVISLVILLMTRFDWYAHPMANQILRIQIPDGTPFDTLFDRAFSQVCRFFRIYQCRLGRQWHLDRTDLQRRHKEIGPDSGIPDRDQEPERQAQGDADRRIQRHRSVEAGSRDSGRKST